MKKQQSATLFATFGQTHCFRIPSHKDPLQELAMTLQNALKHNWDSPIYLASVIADTELTTEFKTFNKQTNCISDGNISANTMAGQYIRPRNRPDSAGKIGGQYTFDIQSITSRLRDPALTRWLQQTLDALPACETETVAVYIFFTHTGKTRNVIGALVVDAARNLLARTVGGTAKHDDVLHVMCEQLTNQGVLNKTLAGQVVDGALVLSMKTVAPYLDQLGCAYRFAAADIPGDEMAP